ncbi:hypothetical protein BIFBRE_04113 [Bifidobacterium breve DSM 20213 = JCM 1192]|uniref:Uncharacterized protein n=1 Tax=Bifidobacterium breve DSM 20213 = JCM 1192 TaxID=518634 RepID=D4BPU8_BIFBR|nr:hypothetical protein BIFBRE_04113 [Bifidobacterium breve DSM 20213 = JCM 1192]
MLTIIRTLLFSTAIVVSFTRLGLFHWLFSHGSGCYAPALPTAYSGNSHIPEMTASHVTGGR